MVATIFEAHFGEVSSRESNIPEANLAKIGTIVNTNFGGFGTN